MAQVHGRAGAATYHKGDRLMYEALVPMVIMGILIYLLFRSRVQFTGFLGAGVVCIVVALGFWCVRDVFSLEAIADQYYGGAGGEYDVGAVLLRLPHEFHVFNGLGFYAGDVDHVIIGPTGVFVVETKNHIGTINLRDGRLCRNGKLLDHDFVHQVTSEAMYVKGQLKPRVPCHVRPLLVFVRARVRVPTAVNGVRVITLSSLADAIVGRAPSLSPEDIQCYVERLGGSG
ncbi:MAG: nuclease-related domain-containing protein [Candidatus Cryosericum sp.]